jgi:hypothetical protein
VACLFTKIATNNIVSGILVNIAGTCPIGASPVARAHLSVGKWTTFLLATRSHPTFVACALAIDTLSAFRATKGASQRAAISTGPPSTTSASTGRGTRLVTHSVARTVFPVCTRRAVLELTSRAIVALLAVTSPVVAYSSGSACPASTGVAFRTP